MKLELKHLAAYLPYGITICDTGKYRKNTYQLDVNFLDIMHDYGFNYFKLALRPLSDLTKEIGINGEKFYPLDRIKESQHQLFFRSDIENPVEGLQFSEVQILLSWHFDIFGLIDAGLAIDINTLKL